MRPTPLWPFPPYPVLPPVRRAVALLPSKQSPMPIFRHACCMQWPQGSRQNAGMNVPPSSGGILVMISAPRLHTWGSSWARAWGAPLSVLLREYHPAAPRPHGKRDKQKGSKGAHMGHSAQNPRAAPRPPCG